MDSPGLLQALLYGLAPGGDPESFIVTPRRRQAATSGTVVLPASGSNTASAVITLQDTLNVDDGLFFEMFTGIFTPVDNSGKTQIVDTQLYLAVGLGGPLFLPLASPTATTLFPRVGTSLQFAPPPLLTFRDLAVFANLVAFEPNLLAKQPLSLILQVSANNTDTAPHSVILGFTVMYRRVQGLLGA